MKQKHTIYIVSSALRALTAEAVRWKRQGKESGGALVGVQRGSASYILYAFDSGNADHSSSHITTDVEYQNRCFAKVQGRYPDRLRYLCDWHVHPMYLASLSTTDLRACEQILKDPAHEDLEGIPLILVTFRRGSVKPVIVPFWIHRGNSGPCVEKAKLVTLSPDDIRVKTILGASYIPVAQLNKSEKGKTRLERRMSDECDQLLKAFGSCGQSADMGSGGVSLRIKARGASIAFAIPPEYPMNPPYMYIDSGDGFVEHVSKNVWNSLSSLAELASEVVPKRGVSSES